MTSPVKTPTTDSPAANPDNAVWVVGRRILKRWMHITVATVANQLTNNSHYVFHPDYIEFRFHIAPVAMLRRTASGVPGFAITLSDPHETHLALTFLSSTITDNPSLSPYILAAPKAQQDPRFSDLKRHIARFLPSPIPVLTAVLRPTPICITRLSAAGPHPSSILAACAVAFAVHALQEADSDPVPDDKLLRHPKDLLNLPTSHRLLNNVHLSVEYTPVDQTTPTKSIFNLKKDSHRMRCNSLPHASSSSVVTRFFVHRSHSPDVTSDIKTLFFLLRNLHDDFPDDGIDTDGLTLARLVSDNACRWHWRNSDAMSAELVRRSTTATKENLVYLVGLTGEGKSTTFNKILQLRPDVDNVGGNRAAKVGASKSTTKTVQEGILFSDSSASDSSVRKTPGPSWVIADTPGLSDDSGRDRHFLSEMMDYMSHRSTANLVLLVKQKAARIDDKEREAIAEYSKLFGKDFGQMLRIVCTNIQVLQPTGEDTEKHQVNVKSFIDSATSLFEEFGVTFGVEQRIFFIGDVKEIVIPNYGPYMPIRDGAPDPRRELERLREEIRNSRSHMTVSARMLRELLRDADSFWRSPMNMKAVTEQTQARIWFNEVLFNREKSLCTKNVAVFNGVSKGVIQLLNTLVGSRLGGYSVTKIQLEFHAETENTMEEVQKTKSASQFFRRGTNFLVALIEERTIIEDGERLITRRFELLERGQQLSEAQKRRVATTVLGKCASREEMRAGLMLCDASHHQKPEMWIV